MSNLHISIPIASIIPILNAMVFYLDTKYPCDTDENCGDDMPIDDEAIYHTHSFLAATFNKNKDIYIKEYEKLFNQLTSTLGVNRAVKS